MDSGGRDGSATRLAVRARGARAGQDQIVDELAFSNLIYGRSINQADFFAACASRAPRPFLAASPIYV